jgi:hypothetical protein
MGAPIVRVRVVEPAYLLGRSVLSEVDGDQVVLLVSRALAPDARTSAVKRATDAILAGAPGNDRDMTGS